MEIEIPTWLYELLLNEAAETGSAIEDIAEFAFRKYIERIEDNAERQETVTVSDCEGAPEEVGEQPKEQDATAVSDDFEAEDADEDEELYEEQDEGMAMGM